MCPGMEPSAQELAWLEEEWVKWLKSLNPWELHFLTSSFRELDWHDDFVSGAVSLDDMTALLEKRFPQSVGV